MSGKPAHESGTSPVADDAAQDETLDDTARAQQESQAPTLEGPGDSSSASDAAEQSEGASTPDGADQPDVEQIEALAQGIQEHGILLAGVVDLDAHEAAPAGVGQQLGDGGP